MGHWLDNDRQAKCRVTNEAKRSSQPASWNGRQIVSGLSKSTRSGPAAEGFAGAALDMPCVPTPVNVWRALRVSSSVEIWGHKEVEDCVSITQQMHAPRELSEESQNSAMELSFLGAPPFFPVLALKQAKALRLVKTLIYCTITVIE